MKDLTKGALIGSAAAASAVAVTSAVSAVMTHSLIRIAFYPALPFTPSIKVKKLFSGCKDMEGIERLCEKNAAKLEKGDCRRIEILGRSGEHLVGHLHTAEHPKRAIIAMHGWRTTWARDFGAVSEFWHKNDCTVLYAEQRGHSDSEGSFITFGLSERYDCLEWIRHLSALDVCRGLPIYLCGVSMGAATVLMTTGFHLPPCVRGVVADCGFTSPHGVFKHVVNKNLHFPYGYLTRRQIDGLCKKRMSIDVHGYSTIAAMKVCTVPVMFVHGTADRFVPIQMTYDNYSACASPKRMFIVPGADHGMSYFTDKEGYERELLRFFADCEAVDR